MIDQDYDRDAGLLHDWDFWLDREGDDLDDADRLLTEEEGNRVREVG